MKFIKIYLQIFITIAHRLQNKLSLRKSYKQKKIKKQEKDK